MGDCFIGSREVKNNYKESKSKYIKGSYWSRSGILSNYICKLYNGNKNIKIAEVGVSGGDILFSLYKNGYKNLLALDINNYIKYPELNNYFKEMDASRNNIPVETASLDIILSIALIEHLENPINFINEAIRVLKSGGRLIVSFPNVNTWLDKITFLFKGDIFGYRKDNNHIFIITPAIFHKLFLRNFNIEKVMYADPFIPYIKPRRLNKFLPKSRFLSLKVCYILIKK